MVLITLCLAYAPKLVMAQVMVKQQGKYDNAHPRQAYNELTGLGARAVGAHQNGLEAFASFAVGVLACMFTGISLDWVNALASAFVVLRVAYVALYLGNLPTARSAVWGLGFLIVLTLLTLPVLRLV
jgi:uncharacterized MAPEG superfamily protein